MKKAALFLLALCTLIGIPQAYAQQAASNNIAPQNTAFTYLFTTTSLRPDKAEIKKVESTGKQQPGVTFCTISFNKHAAQPYYRLNATTVITLAAVQAWLQPAGITVTHFYSTNSEEARLFLNAHP